MILFDRLAFSSIIATLCVIPIQFAEAQQTYFSFDSSPTTWVGRGYTDYKVTPEDGWEFEVIRNLVPGGNAENDIYFYLDLPLPIDPEEPQPADDWALGIGAAFNGVLVPGSYPNATRLPFQRDTAPGITLTGNLRGLNTLSGSFEILEAEYAADGSVARFAMDFTIHEKFDATRWIIGQIRYQSLIDEPTAGDLNGDGQLTNADIAPFVQALTDRSVYNAAFPELNADILGDFSGDGALTNGDISGFVDALTGSASTPVPEPSALALLGLAGLLVSRRRR